jgi:ParB/RepB/Spo0J family partition protein
MVSPAEPTIRSCAVDDLDLRYRHLRLPSPQAVARLRQSLQQEGVRNPILVSTGVEPGKLVVIDGIKRLEAARQLGMTHLPVHAVDLDPVAAEIAIIQANAGQRGLSDFEAGVIVQRLHREHGLSQVEIGERLGRHRTWVCRRLALVERLDSGVQEELRLGLVSASIAREVAQLPRGTQAPAARTISAHRLSSRQATRLVRMLRVADPAHRRNILDRPLEHLPARRGEEPYPADPRLGAAGNRIRQSLLRIEASAHRLLESFRTHDPRSFRNVEGALLAELGARILPAAREASAGIERLALSSDRRDHAES